MSSEHLEAAAAAADYGRAQSVFVVPLSTLLGSSEYVPLAADIVRMVCIQLTIQIMLFLSGAPFLSAEVALVTLYVILGVMLYWLAMRKLVTFV